MGEVLGVTSSLDDRNSKLLCKSYEEYKSMNENNSELETRSAFFNKCTNLSEIPPKYRNYPMSATIKGELEPLSGSLVLSMPTRISKLFPSDDRKSKSYSESKKFSQHK